MHLSLLSDLDRRPFDAPPTSGRADRAHYDGLLRGLAFAAALAMPLTLAIVTGHRQSPDPSAGYAQTFDARP